MYIFMYIYLAALPYNEASELPPEDVAKLKAVMRANKQRRIESFRPLAEVVDGVGEYRSFHGMGSQLTPIKEDVLNRFLLKCARQFGISMHHRGGVRQIAEQLLQEPSLVYAPKQSTLVRKSLRPCGKLHPGFCKKVDADIGPRYQELRTALKRLILGLPGDQVPLLAVYCRDEGLDEFELDEFEIPTFLILYGGKDGAPTYGTYYNCVVDPGVRRLDEYPFTVTLSVLTGGAIPSQGAYTVFEDYLRPSTFTEHALSVSMARRGTSQVLIKRLKSTVGDFLGEYVVNGAQVLTNDLWNDVCCNQRTPTTETEKRGIANPLDVLRARRISNQRNAKKPSRPAPQHHHTAADLISLIGSKRRLNVVNESRPSVPVESIPAPSPLIPDRVGDDDEAEESADDGFAEKHRSVYDDWVDADATHLTTAKDFANRCDNSRGKGKGKGKGKGRGSAAASSSASSSDNVIPVPVVDLVASALPPPPPPHDVVAPHFDVMTATIADLTDGENNNIYLPGRKKPLGQITGWISKMDGNYCMGASCSVCPGQLELVIANPACGSAPKPKAHAAHAANANACGVRPPSRPPYAYAAWDTEEIQIQIRCRNKNIQK